LPLFLCLPSSWDDLYTTEIVNHAANPADEGTVWFDDSDAEAKMLNFLDDVETDPDRLSLPALATTTMSAIRLDREETSFLDLGCGNGSLLFSLRDAGWNGRLLGVDYSAQSVALAQQIAKTRRSNEQEDGEDDEGVEGSEDDVVFQIWDVLNGSLSAVVPEAGIENSAQGWDVVLDKGTFDAVSLSAERDDRGRRISEGYRERVIELLRLGGLFLVTSCNWTEHELRGWFEGDVAEVQGAGDGVVDVGNASAALGGRLRQVGTVEYRSFSFGGVKGQTISTVCFMKVV
jgi:SAM-dependent methyltransferase